MALNKIVEIVVYGEKIILRNAYVKIDRVNGNKTQVQAKYVVYSNKDGEIVEEKYCDFTPDMDGANFIKQAYEHLKTMPEFAGATDC
jgi:hypothetical protein